LEARLASVIVANRHRACLNALRSTCCRRYALSLSLHVEIRETIHGYDRGTGGKHAQEPAWER